MSCACPSPAQPLASIDDLTLEKLVRVMEQQLPQRGASECRYQVSDSEQRGEFWIAIDWESRAFAFAQAHSFVGRTLDGQVFSSSGAPSGWEYIDAVAGAEVQFEREDLDGWIPAFRILEAVRRSPQSVLIRPAGDGSGFILEASQPMHEGEQRVIFRLDAWARVIEVEAGEPVPSFPIRYSYSNPTAGVPADAVIPVRVVRKLTASRDVAFVRTALDSHERAMPEMFAPERARVESTDAKRHVFSTQVDGNAESGDTRPGEKTPGASEDLLVAPMTPANVESPVGTRSAALIILGALLIVVAIVVLIRRHA